MVYSTRVKSILVALLALFVGCQQVDTPSETSEATVDNASLKKNTAKQTSTKPAPFKPLGTFDWVHRPRFDAVYGNAIAGTCFTAELKDRDEKLLVTALSLLGQSGGMAYDFRTNQLHRYVTSVHLQTGDQFEPIEAYPLISIDAMSLGYGSEAGDLAVFRLPDDSKFAMGQFSDQPVTKRQRLWLLAPGHSNDDNRIVPHPIRINRIETAQNIWTPNHMAEIKLQISGQTSTTNSQRTNLVYSFIDEDINTLGLLGAPLINRSGEVVGIHSRTSFSQDGKPFGYGVPTTRFLPHVKQCVAVEQAGPVVEVSGYTLNLPCRYTKTASLENQWQSVDDDGNPLTIKMEVIPNRVGMKSTDHDIRQLLEKNYAELTKGHRGSSRSGGTIVDRPGLRLIVGSYSASANKFKGLQPHNGIIGIGLNEDHLVKLEFRTQACPDDNDPVTQPSTTHLFVERAFNTLKRIGVKQQQMHVANPPIPTNPIEIEIHGLSALDLPTIAPKLTDALQIESSRGVLLNLTRQPITATTESTTPLLDIASRIKLGTTPEIDVASNRIRYHVKPEKDLADMPDSLEKHLKILENGDWRLNPEQSLTFLAAANPKNAESDDIRKRVAICMQAQLTIRPFDCLGKDYLFETIRFWDETIARETYIDLVKHAPWPTHGDALTQLRTIADESAVAPVAYALLNQTLSHFDQEAVAFLRRYPRSSEKHLLDLLGQSKYASLEHVTAAVEFLKEVGGPPSTIGL